MTPYERQNSPTLPDILIRKDRDGVREEIKIVPTRAKVPGFTGAGKLGLSGEVMPTARYKALIG